MLSITVELIPHGRRDQTKELANLVIINQGTGTLERGNYVVRAIKGDDGVEYTTYITDWDRSRSAYELMVEAIKQLEGLVEASAHSDQREDEERQEHAG